MAYNALNNLIDAYIYANGVQAITGQILNGVLKQMVSQLGSGYHLMGVAGPETVPASNDYAMAYFAATAGEYTDFGGITLAAGEVAVLLTSGNGSWSKQAIYNVPTGTADLENTANFITNAVTDLVNYYTKTEVDDTLANYPTLEALATALADYYTKTQIDGQKAETDAALADRYTKSETDAKLADYYKKTETYDKDEVDSIIAALSRQEYIVAWNGLAAPDVSAIPAGVTVTYSGTTYTGTLAASASTVNKIYMVWNGTAYDMYGTSQDGGFSWVPMGTTSVDLSQFATKAEVSQLEAELNQLGQEVATGEAMVSGNMDGIGWSNTYLSTGSQSSRTDNNKRLSNIAPFKVGVGNRLHVSLQSGFQIMISYFDNKTTDARSSFVGYTAESGDYVAKQDYVIVTFKKVVNETEQVITEADIYGQVSFEDNISESIAKIQQEVDDLEAEVSQLDEEVSQLDGGINGNIDYSNLDNVYSPTGDYSLAPNPTRLSTVTPIYTGTFKTVTITVPEGIEFSANTYAELTASAIRKGHVDYGGTRTFVSAAEYMFISFRRTDNGNISKKDIYGTRLQIHSFSETEYIVNKYGSFGQVDFSKLPYAFGGINTNTGQAYDHKSRMVSGLIPVKPLSRFKIQSTYTSGVYYSMTVYFYNVSSKGDVTWQSQYYYNSEQTQRRVEINPGSGQMLCEVIVPPTCNACAFYFDPSSGVTDVSAASSQLSLYCVSSSTPVEIGDVYNDISKVVRFNDIDAQWLQGEGYSNLGVPQRCCCNKFFRVYEGQKIAIKFSNANNAYIAYVRQYTDPANGMFPATYKDVNIVQEIYTVPSGVNFIAFVVKSVNDAETLTPEQQFNNDWHIADVTLDSSPIKMSYIKSKTVRDSSYAQALEIQNGYLFQAFADGYIEIYEIATMAMKAKLACPVSNTTAQSVMHCNNLTFGDKYNADDTFGILWVNNNEIGSNMVGIRVQENDGDFSFTKVYEVTPPTLDSSEYGADDQYIDFVNKRLVVVAYKLNANISRPSDSHYTDVTFFVYSFTGKFEDANFTLQKTFTFPIMWAVQGGRLIDRLLYLVSGPAVSSINVFDIVRGKLLDIINLTDPAYGITDEAQGLAFDECSPYITSTDSSTHLWTLYKVSI